MQQANVQPNYCILIPDSFQPEMLLNPGSRLPRNGRMSQSTGQLDVDSGYPARGPQRDFSTLPPYHEPPSFEEAMRQSGRKPKTRKSTGDLANQPHHNRGGPGPARRSGRRPRQSQGQPADEPTDSSDAEPRFTPHRTAPPPPRFRLVCRKVSRGISCNTYGYRRLSFRRNCVLRRWEIETLKYHKVSE